MRIRSALIAMRRSPRCCAGCETLSPSCRPEFARPSKSVRRSFPTRGKAWRPPRTKTGSRASAGAWQRRPDRCPAHEFAGDIRREGRLLLSRVPLCRGRRRRRAAIIAGSSSSAAAAEGTAFESFKPFFCYVEVEGDLLTIVKQTGSQRPAGACGRTTTRPPDLPRQPCARQRGPAAGLWRRSQARHGRRVRADRAVPLAAGHSLAAKHVASSTCSS